LLAPSLLGVDVDDLLTLNDHSQPSDLLLQHLSALSREMSACL
jgi:hypothetical protein